MRPLFIRGVKTIDIARRAEADAERKRRYAAKRRKELAARAAEERKVKEDEDHEKMVHACYLGADTSWLAKHVKRGRTFEQACAIAGVNADAMRKLLQNPPANEGWDAHYVLPALAYLRRRLDAAKVDWE
jgi:hypothetical protein